MNKRIRPSDLSEREQFLLGLTDRGAFAARCYISQECLRFWVKLGLPRIRVGRKDYFDPIAIQHWLDKRRRGENRSNCDRLWDETQAHLLPHTVVVVDDIQHPQNIRKGTYWIVPAGGGDDA